MNSAVLVTGGAGYIGSHTCKRLAQAGFLPVTLDNLEQGHRWAVRWGPLVVGDLGDPDLLKTVIQDYRIQAVLHFAAYAYVGESVENPRKYMRFNVINALNLLDAMVEMGVRDIIFSSTCATYGIPDKVPMSEEMPQRPVNPYGESKLFIERALDWYGKAYGIRWVALRYFNAAGADPHGEIGEEHCPETHLIPLVIQAALGRSKHVSVFGTDYPTQDGTAVRDYVHVQDLAEAHVLAMRYLQSGGSSLGLNLGTGQGHSVRQVIKAVEMVSGRTVPVRDEARRPGDPPALVADPSKATRLLGWRAKFASLEDIVETALRWHATRWGLSAHGSGRP
ncbi:MAG: UDP-glucose 4-epimerase GalE [Thermodesulfobacteriota bacterium]